MSALPKEYTASETIKGMPIRDMLLPEFNQEMAGTRTTLQRVPAGKMDFKPHAKSPTMEWLANHVSSLPMWGIMTIERDLLDIAPPEGSPPPPAPLRTAEELVASFDEKVQKFRSMLESIEDERLLAPWSLLKGGQTVMTLPRVAVLRGFVMNHMIHHRAQLTVYLRMNDVPVPALYGPSADEGTL